MRMRRCVILSRLGNFPPPGQSTLRVVCINGPFFLGILPLGYFVFNHFSVSLLVMRALFGINVSVLWSKIKILIELNQCFVI